MHFFKTSISSILDLFPFGYDVTTVSFFLVSGLQQLAASCIYTLSGCR